LRCRVDVLARTRLASQKNRSIVSYVVFFGEDQWSPQVAGKRSTVNCSSALVEFNRSKRFFAE